MSTIEGSLPIVLVAVRMSSSRLPAKALMKFGGETTIGCVVSAANAAHGTGGVVVATSDQPSDDAIVEWCSLRGVQVYRGDLDNVAGRMLAAAANFGASSFVRISGDSPMLDPTLITHAVSEFTSKNVDLVTNVNPRSFPPGQSVEVIRTQTCERLLESEKLVEGDLEHVTPILYRNEGEIAVSRFTPFDVPSTSTALAGPYRSMSIDTITDAVCFQHVVAKEGDANVWKLGWQQCGVLMRMAQEELNTD